MQDTDKGKILLQKYLNGEADSKEQAIVESWQLSFPLTERKILNDEEALADLLEIRKQLLEISASSKNYKLWPRIAAAASIIFVLAIGMYFYVSRIQNLNNLSQIVAQNDIVPGSNKAILTLANGRKIVLSDAIDGELTKEQGLSIEKTANGQLKYTIADRVESGAQSPDQLHAMNTISTPRGGQYQVNLPDGTKVWLNAESSISFPLHFSAVQKRRVALKGEAYFEVAKIEKEGKITNHKLPFIVATDKQEVEVLGTHFNINAYSDENAVKTTLLEGAVRVTSLPMIKQAFNNVNLLPGQQAVLTRKAIKVVPVDTDMAVAWKNGYFKFTDEPIPAIMRRLSRWYNVDIIYDDNDNSARFGGKISRDKSIAEVLEMLASTNRISFKIEGRKIIVK